MIANILCGVVAFEHVYFLILEMFLWRKPFGLKTFGQSQAQADTTATLAANQGLYNGFLAAGLVWGVGSSNPDFAFAIKAFFLGCVVVAGIFGGMTVKRTIFFIQGVPAILALAALFLIH